MDEEEDDWFLLLLLQCNEGWKTEGFFFEFVRDWFGCAEENEEDDWSFYSSCSEVKVKIN